MTTLSRHLAFTYLFRGSSMVVNFVLTPVILIALGDEGFGIWSVIVSILNWIIFFDLGIVNGLKNKVTQSVAVQDFVKARRYFSSGYAGITMAATSLMGIGLAFILAFNWQNIFNTEVAGSELQAALLISLIFASVNFSLSIVKSGYYAIQQSAIPSLILLLQQSLFLLSILALDRFLSFNLSLVDVSLLFGASQFCMNTIFTVIFFKKRPYLTPLFREIKKKELKDVTGLGLAFFFLQLTGLVLYFTDNVLISGLFTPVAVTNYQIPFKLFSVISILHNMLMTNLWPAYTKAFSELNFTWVQKVLRRLKLLQLVLIIGVIAMLFVAPYIIPIWLGREFETSFGLLLAIGANVVLVSWNAIYIYLLNGMGHTKFNLWVSATQAIINIPLSLMFVYWFDFGPEGVVWGTNVTLILGTILFPIFVPGIMSKYQKSLQNA